MIALQCFFGMVSRVSVSYTFLEIDIICPINFLEFLLSSHMDCSVPYKAYRVYMHAKLVTLNYIQSCK